MDIRRSSATSANQAIKKTTPKRGQGNAKWLASRVQPGAVVLVGGASLEHFRLRVAQSHLRHDLLPSFWSLAGVAATSTSFLTVPITIRDASTRAGHQRRRVHALQRDRRCRALSERGGHQLCRAVGAHCRERPPADGAAQRARPPVVDAAVAGVHVGRGQQAQPAHRRRRDAVSRARADRVRHGGDRDDAGVVVWVDVSRGDLAVGVVVARLLPEDGGRERRSRRDRQDGAIKRAPSERPKAIVPRGESCVRQKAAAVSDEG